MKKTGRSGPAQVRHEPTQVSGRWLAAAVGGTIAAAAVCGWCALCLLFWQGSWQLLYHPAAAVSRTPASAGLTYDPVEFDPSPEGASQLKGWWVPAAPGAAFGRYTVLLLHGQTGNIGDQVDALAQLHAVGVNAMAFDYRGYGQSQFARPSEEHWQQDAESALAYLTATRHVDAGAIIPDGEGLGANLALEVAAAHPELAGVILESPLESPMNAIFDDARAKMVPARLLVRDRYDISAPARALQIRSLLLLPPNHLDIWNTGGPLHDLALRLRVKGLGIIDPEDGDFEHVLRRWLADLPTR